MFYSLSPLDQISQKVITQCPVCGAKKEHLKIVKIEEKDDNYLVYIKCSKCLSGLIGAVNFGVMGVSVISTVTDLEEEETTRFLEESEVTPDDILDLHEILEEKGEIFLELIKNKPKKKYDLQSSSQNEKNLRKKGK